MIYPKFSAAGPSRYAIANNYGIVLEAVEKALELLQQNTEPNSYEYSCHDEYSRAYDEYTERCNKLESIKNDLATLFGHIISY